MVNASPDSVATPAVACHIVVAYITPEGVAIDGSLNVAATACVSVDAGSAKAAGVTIHPVAAALVIPAAA